MTDRNYNKIYDKRYICEVLRMKMLEELFQLNTVKKIFAKISGKN